MHNQINPSRRNYRFLGDPVGPYSHAVRHNGALYLSGLTAFGSPAEGASMADQLEVVLGQIRQVAETEQVSLAALIKVTIFVTGFAEVDAVRGVLTRAYGDHPPASSLVQVSGLFSSDISVEVEAILAVA